MVYNAGSGIGSGSRAHTPCNVVEEAVELHLEEVQAGQVAAGRAGQERWRVTVAATVEAAVVVAMC